MGFLLKWLNGLDVIRIQANPRPNYAMKHEIAIAAEGIPYYY